MGRLLRTGVISASLLAAAGCGDGGGLGGSGDGPATAALDRPAATRLVERDVEAPDVFSANENGLWDGRPSLGGVWVAHPDVQDPERVIIRNETSGKFVIGALFKRERDNPGPKLQLSSDAANALGVLPGAPTRLSVVALRREEVPEAAPATGPSAAAPAMADAIAAPEAIEQKSLDAPLAAAAAAIDEAEGRAEGAVQVAAAPAPAQAQTQAQTQAQPEAKKGFWARLGSKQERRAKADAVIAADPHTAAATPAIAPAAAPAPVQASAPAAPSGGGGKGFVQIGIFSVQANADRTADTMRKAGVVPTVYEQESAGKTFWRVVIGPAHSAADRTALLEKVKAMGFQDAYLVTN